MPGRTQTKQLLPQTTFEDKYEVEEILKRKGKGRNVKYLVKWKGYDETESTWETPTSLKNAQELVDEFNRLTTIHTNPATDTENEIFNYPTATQLRKRRLEFKGKGEKCEETILPNYQSRTHDFSLIRSIDNRTQTAELNNLNRFPLSRNNLNATGTPKQLVSLTTSFSARQPD